MRSAIFIPPLPDLFAGAGAQQDSRILCGMLTDGSACKICVHLLVGGVSEEPSVSVTAAVSPEKVKVFAPLIYQQSKPTSSGEVYRNRRRVP